MDGNRRWAEQQGVLPWYGHRKGIDVLATIIDFCRERSIEHLSLYAFSLENFNRPVQETKFLFELMASEADRLIQECIAKKVTVRFLGDRSYFPEALIPVCERIENETQGSAVLQVYLLFCYGARQEMTHAVQEIVRKQKAGMLDADAIDEQMIADHLWTAGIPDPDLVVRTGGAQRLSNFLLHQSAYSELYFTPTLWPDMTKKEWEVAYQYFRSCRRNFGS